MKMFEAMRLALEKSASSDEDTASYDMHDLEETLTSNRCPHCNSDYLCQKDPDIVCLDCGANLGSNIDNTPEWRNDQNSGEDLSRCNLTRNEMLPESSLSTCIMLGPHATRAQYDLQRTMVWSSIPHNERSLRNKINDISYICHINDIPEAIIEVAQHQYYKLISTLESQHVTRKRGKNDAGMKAAALFMAFQDSGKPRTYKELAKLFGIESRYVSEGINLFDEYVRPNSQTNCTVYSDYIEQCCRNLDLSQEICDRVIVIADKANALGILENNTPISIVAGCIYYAAVEYALSLKPIDIATSCGVSAPTINKVCNKLFSRAMDLL